MQWVFESPAVIGPLPEPLLPEPLVPLLFVEARALLLGMADALLLGLLRAFNGLCTTANELGIFETALEFGASDAVPATLFRGDA